MNKNIKILVCCHKKDIMATSEPYLPIHVGKSLSDTELDIQPDNTGENISEKNRSYCELTGMYWAWKNLKDTDIIGLCHYRRYFDFHSKGIDSHFDQILKKTSDFNHTDLSIPEGAFQQIKDGVVVVPRPWNVNESIKNLYCEKHISDDFRIMEQVIRESGDRKYIQAFWKLMYESNRQYYGNMFIMTWHDFNAYCSWVFDILAKIEQLTDITHYKFIQGRIYGYMSERLFNVFLIANNFKTIERPVIYFNDNARNYNHSFYDLIKYKLGCWRNNIGFNLLRPHKSHY